MHATADFTYTEPLFLEYRTVRNARQMRFLGKFAIVASTPLLLVFLAMVSIGEPVAGLLFLAMGGAILALGIKVQVTGTVIKAASKSVYEHFFARHGDVTGPRPWSFRESVTVDDEGATIRYGTLGTSAESMAAVTKSWSEFKSVHQIDGAIIVLSRTKMAPAIYWMLGVNYAFYDEKRDQFEDVVIPPAALEGAEPDELVAFLRHHVGMR